MVSHKILYRGQQIPRPLEAGQLGAGLGAGLVQLGPGLFQRRGLLIDRQLGLGQRGPTLVHHHPERLVVQPHQQGVLLDVLVVVGQHLFHDAGHARGDVGDVAVDVGVVRRDVAKVVPHPRHAEDARDRQRHDGDAEHDESAQPIRTRRERPEAAAGRPGRAGAW